MDTTPAPAATKAKKAGMVKAKEESEDDEEDDEDDDDEEDDDEEEEEEESKFGSLKNKYKLSESVILPVFIKSLKSDHHPIIKMCVCCKMAYVLYFSLC